MDIQPMSGIWVHGGYEYHDEMIRFVVDTKSSPEADQFFSDLKARLKERFQQIEIWITATPIRIL
ncbi:MAG: hypothetical protein HY920_07855 [Elusimicrobia bacterium]|nr:hypothetical protein [Elusimicrobiota bacterium]